MSPGRRSFTHWRTGALAGLLLLAGFVGGCSTARTIDYKEAELVRAAAEVPDAERLDVGIILFDPGIGADSLADEKKLVFPEVRQAEARYMPYQLKTTLESSGYWGSVWVVPQRSDAVDLTVTGRIDLSNGLDVNVHIGAWDATGREWLNKSYKVQVPEKAYSKLREPGQDPYQTMYNEIANDLLAIRRKMSAGELRTLRMRSRVIVNNAEAYIACCLAGLGLIQLPAYDGAPYLASGGLVSVMPEHRAPAMPMTLLYPHRRHLSRRLQVFIEWLEGVLRRATQAGGATP